MKITRRDLLKSASATWATTILSKPASAAAEFEASFYTQWQKTYGAEAWARLEQYTGRLT